MSSARGYGRPGDRRIDQKHPIRNQHHDSNRGSRSFSIQRGQRENHRWNWTMSRQYEDRCIRSQTSSRYRCSQRSSGSWRSSEVEAVTFPEKSRHNESYDYAKRLESTSSRKRCSRYSRPRESRSTSRGRDRKRRSKESWTRSSRSISRERFLNLRRYWSKSRSRSSSAQGSVDERSPRFWPNTNDFVFQESREMVNFESNFFKGPNSRPGSALCQQSPAKPIKCQAKSPAKSSKSPVKSSKSPAKSFKSPAKSFKSPAKSFKSPAKSFKSPAKSSKSPANSSESSAEVRVANLTSNVTKGHLIEIFLRCGRLKNVELDRCRGAEPRAFIEFYNKTDAECAISTMNEGEIDGKLIEVTLVGGSSRVRAASPKIIFRHRTPPPMPHAMMIKTGRLLNQRRFVDPMRDKIEAIPRDFNRKHKYRV